MAAMTRTSTFTVFEEPTGSKVRSWSTRSSFTCRFGLMSPISSRKIVPAVRHGEAPLAVADGVGEGALDVAEELGFEQLLGDCAAVDRDQHPLGTTAVVVERPGDELLAGAALSRDQHRAVGVRHLLDDGEHPLQRCALSDDVVELVAGAELAVERAVLGLEAAVLDGLLDQAAHHVEALLLEGLLEVPEGAGPQGLDGVLGAAVAGDHDAGQIRLDLVDLPHELEAVDARHLDVSLRAQECRF